MTDTILVSGVRIEKRAVSYRNIGVNDAHIISSDWRVNKPYLSQLWNSMQHTWNKCSLFSLSLHRARTHAHLFIKSEQWTRRIDSVPLRSSLLEVVGWMSKKAIGKQQLNIYGASIDARALLHFIAYNLNLSFLLFIHFHWHFR